MVKFQCLVYKPIKGEVFDAVVTSIDQRGFKLFAGHCTIFVPYEKMPTDLKFMESN